MRLSSKSICMVSRAPVVDWLTRYDAGVVEPPGALPHESLHRWARRAVETACASRCHSLLVTMRAAVDWTSRSRHDAVLAVVEGAIDPRCVARGGSSSWILSCVWQYPYNSFGKAQHSVQGKCGERPDNRSIR